MEHAAVHEAPTVARTECLERVTPAQQTAAGYAALAGRILMSVIFILSGVMKLTHHAQSVGYAQSAGLPLASLAIWAAGAVEVLGGLSLIAGWYARWSALVLAVYLIPTTLVFHHFWTLGGAAQQMQQVNFLKNVSIIGGLLVVGALGAGPLSLDARRAAPPPGD